MASNLFDTKHLLLSIFTFIFLLADCSSFRTFFHRNGVLRNRKFWRRPVFHVDETKFIIHTLPNSEELPFDDELEIRLKLDSDIDKTFNEEHFKSKDYKKSQNIKPMDFVEPTEHTEKFIVAKDVPNCYEKRQSLAKELTGKKVGFLPMCDNFNERLFSETQCADIVNDIEADSNFDQSKASDNNYFCWCANSNNGKPLAGSTTFNGIPGNCHKIRGKVTLSPKIKGCTSDHQTRFYERLFYRFSLEKSTNETAEKELNSFENNQYVPTELRTGREMLARWKFNEMDTNQDQIVDKSEWKEFREHIRKWSRFHKCARNFIRSCDIDRNRKLVVSEWITCTILAYERSRMPPKAQLNPFIYVLKSA